MLSILGEFAWKIKIELRFCFAQMLEGFEKAWILCRIKFDKSGSILMGFCSFLNVLRPRETCVSIIYDDQL